MALFPLGILSAAGAGAALVPDYELIETVSVGTAVSTISFSGLGTYASTYKHLQIRGTVRTTRSSPNTNDVIWLRMNSDTGSNYAWHDLRGNGSTVTSSAGTSETYIRLAISQITENTANTFAALVADVLDYSSTTKNTTVRSLSGMTAATPFIDLRSGFWNNTAAVTSLTFDKFGTTFAVGTRLSLYGVK